MGSHQRCSEETRGSVDGCFSLMTIASNARPYAALAGGSASTE